MGVKIDKAKAIVRLNAAVDELATCTDKERHAQLEEQIKILNDLVKDENKFKVKEILIKTACTAGLMAGMLVIDRCGVINKNAFSFLPKHI